MEIALEPQIPTYGGGMGVLAGDLLRAAADLKVPMVGVSLLHRKGYFFQKLDPNGWQQEEPAAWVVEDFLKEAHRRVSLNLLGKTVHVRAWKYEIQGVDGFSIPVYLLDTDLPDNSEQDRDLTQRLYGGDATTRLCQEAILGIGGVLMLRALGFKQTKTFHMNEGHASLLTVALLEEQRLKGGRHPYLEEDIDYVKRHCVFTTHTPVPAGHDVFPMDLVHRVLGLPPLVPIFEKLFGQGGLNMTTLALSFSRKVNAVSRKHAEVSRKMFAPHPIESITNGVHAGTWVAASFQALFDRYMPGWRQENFLLRFATQIPLSEIWQAHQENKGRLIDFVNQATDTGMDVETLTVGFARRAATYKRGDLVFRDMERLKKIAAQAGPLQFIFAGKAHPHDEAGKQLIQRIVEAGKQLQGQIRISYLENYDMELGKKITAGCDVWLNNPQPPLEASGTSGMKAALNGVPSLSTLDGWWIEGHVEHLTGWAIDGAQGQELSQEELLKGDAASLYDKLEQVIVPAFYRERDRFIEIMRNAIAINGAFFNAQRMLQQYALWMYNR